MKTGNRKIVNLILFEVVRKNGLFLISEYSKIRKQTGITVRKEHEAVMKRQKHLKHSIKAQFAAIFIALMTGGFCLCWIINSVFLQEYYERNKQNVIEDAYQKLNQLFWENSDTDSDEFNIEFSKICSNSNLTVVVADSSLNLVKSSVREEDLLLVRLMNYIFKNDPNYGQEESAEAKEKDKPEKRDWRGRNEILVEEDRYMIRRENDPHMKTDYLELWGSLDNGNVIIMRTPIESIRESVAVSNRFLGYVGISAAFLCAIIIWFVSKKITKPILELADISEKMTHLDFEAKYVSKEKNEIGILGNHINELSQTLEKTISELKTANNELKNDLKKKEKMEEMRNEFLANVSHELKTPIALIQGYAEGLKEGINDDAESRDFYCEVIMDEAEKMNQLVKNLLTLNQLECGNDTVMLERFDIVELIKNCIQSLDILIRQAEAEVIFEEDNPVYVWADEFKTEEVFMNYLSNAIHYVAGERKIEIKLIRKEQILRISVFNTGAPIPEESIDQLWKKFYKVDKARTREYGGSGVGLSIVKAIMDSFNKEYGVINYENGVAFWFELDCK